MQAGSTLNPSPTPAAVHTPRFWLDEPLHAGDELPLPKRVAHHAINVLRLRDGAAVVLFNGQGGEAQAVLNTRQRSARIERLVSVERESKLSLTLVQAWLVNVKLDWVVEKFVELGGTRLILVPTQRGVVKLSGERLRLRVEHLREVIISACAQSGRTRLPVLEAATSLEQGLRSGAQNAQPMLLMPGASQSLAQAAHGQTALALGVGPEGGFDERETALASALGFQAVHLGPRILRTETAGLAAMAALQAQAGDWLQP